MSRPDFDMEQQLPERFWTKVDRSGDCWLWTSDVDRYGYPQFHYQRRTVYAHRLAYEKLVGPIPAGKLLDHRHTCPKICIRPAHLRPATYGQNQQNRTGATRASSSGVRGVYWHKQGKCWEVRVGHNGRVYHGGLFKDIEMAKAAAVELRNRLFTHNDADRESCVHA